MVGMEFSGPAAEIPLKPGGDGNILLLQLFTLKFPQTSRVGCSWRNMDLYIGDIYIYTSHLRLPLYFTESDKLSLGHNSFYLKIVT